MRPRPVDILDTVSLSYRLPELLCRPSYGLFIDTRAARKVFH